MRPNWKLALGILLAVLAAHWWALDEVAALMGPSTEPIPPPSEITRPMLTRTITLPADVSSPEPATPRAAPGPQPREKQALLQPAPQPASEALVEAAIGSAPVAEVFPVPAATPIAPEPLPLTPVPPMATPAPQPDPAPAASAPTPVPEQAPPPPPPAVPTPTPAAKMAEATALPSPIRPLVWPGSKVLTYQLEVNSFPLPARAELRWRHDGAQYEASLALQSLISVTRTSKGAITPQGLEPLRYGEKITARSETAVHFQRDKGIVTFSNNKPSVALLAGMQDEVSVFFQVAALLGGSPQHFVPGTEIPFQTAESRAVRSLVFVVGKSEVVDLPGGRVPTLYLSHTEPPAYEGARSSKGEIWMAPGLDYLPVHIRITEPSGTTYDLRWSQTSAP